jgi:putative transposase
VKLARQKPRHGYRRLHVLLSKRGHPASAQRIYRLYREERLMLRRLRRKRLVRLSSEGRLLLRSNQEWAVDFACDALATGRSIRMLAIVDVFTRECLTLEVDTSLSSQRVTRSIDSMRQRTGAYLAALLSLVRGAEDPADPHSTGTTDAERPCGKLQWTTAG